MAPRGGMDAGLWGAGFLRARKAVRLSSTKCLTVVAALLEQLNADATGSVMELSFMVVHFPVQNIPDFDGKGRAATHGSRSHDFGCEVGRAMAWS